MNIAEIAIHKRVVTWTVILLILGSGILAYQKLGRLEDPEFTIKVAQVFTPYPGASAQEVSEEVTDRIENAIQQLGNVKYIESINEPGMSTVKVTIQDKFDKKRLPQVWDELRRKVNDAQGQLPPGAGPSLVNDDFGDVYGIFLAVYGDGFSYKDLYDYAKKVRKELLIVPNVRKITLFGVQKEVIFVEISQLKLSQLGISPQQIQSSLAGQNLISPAGQVRSGDLYLRIEPSGMFTSVDDVGNILIIQPGAQNARVTLKDIATIRRGYEDPPKQIMHFNGRPAIGIGISTAEGGNVVTLGDALKKRLTQLRESTPVGLEFGPVWIQSDMVKTAVNGFMVGLLESVVIVIGVLVVAMGWRSASLIGAVLILTVLATFPLMQMKGIMLERISLGALIIALGMLVDNAIVVVEGVQVRAAQGMDKIKAAAEVITQSIWPLLGATLVAIFAFGAIGLSQDNTGEFCRSLFYVILYSLMLSWVLAITVTPLFCYHFLPVSAGSDASVDPYAGGFFQAYKKFLLFCMHRRKETLTLMVVLLVASIAGFGWIKKSFFPPSTTPAFLVHYWLPQGVHIRRTEADVSAIEADVLKMKGVHHVSAFIGQGSPRFLLSYTPEEKNASYGLLIVQANTLEDMNRLLPEVQKHINGKFPDAMTFCRKFQLGPGEPQKLHARLRGPDPEVLRMLEADIVKIFHQQPLVQDIMNDWRQRIPMLRPVIAESAARNAGISRADITNALSSAFEGRSIGTYREGDELLPIVMRGPANERNDPATFRIVRVFSPVAQRYIPLSQVVLDIKTVSENFRIRRRNRLPCLTIKADGKEVEASVAFASLQPAVEKRFNELKKERHLSDYSLEWGGEYEDSGRAKAGIMQSLPLFVILMVFIVIALFSNVLQPLIIWLTVPLGLIGVTFGLLASGQPFGFMAMLGFLSLMGMLIKNSIVLIDEINAQLATGKDPFLAVLDSGVSRVRPVSMAAFTTVLGMVPLLVDAFFVAMAVTIMVGLTFASVLTLIVVPVLYVTLARIPVPDRKKI